MDNLMYIQTCIHQNAICFKFRSHHVQLILTLIIRHHVQSVFRLRPNKVLSLIVLTEHSTYTTKEKNVQYE